MGGGDRDSDWNNVIPYATDSRCSSLTSAQGTFDRARVYDTKSSSSFRQLNAPNDGLDAEADKREAEAGSQRKNGRVTLSLEVF